MTESKTIECNGATVEVTVNDAGAVMTDIIPKENGYYTVEHNDNNLTINITDDKIYLLFDESNIFIPHREGVIPRVVGRHCLPGWLMGELRLLGFEFGGDYDDSGWFGDQQ